jgi:hypothetical protein
MFYIKEKEMSFYLLKSTVKRDEIGDMMLDKNKIESIAIESIAMEDRVDPLVGIIVNMASGDTLKAVYSSLSEARSAIIEMLGDRVDTDTINDQLPQK